MSAHGKGKPIGSGAIQFLEGFGVNAAIILSVLGLVMAAVTLYIVGMPSARWMGFIFLTSPLWLPYLLFHKFFHVWMEYVQLHYDLKQGRTTLEIQFPQEVFKSPLAMELVLNQMYQTASPDNLVETYWDGKHPPVFGLEIVSDGGRIHFYISTPVKKYKNMWESQLYAQYPGIVVTELKTDYTAAVPWEPDKVSLFAIHYKLKNADAYPIKTYIDFGLDKDPKEEYKVEPMAPMLELLGSLGPREKLWVQILISAHRAVDFSVGALHAHDDWKADVKAEIDKIAQRKDPEGGAVDMRATPGERDVIIALERSMSKFAFNTKIRTINMAETEVASILGDRIGPTITMWRAFEDLTRNGIRFAWRTDFNWNWWQDPKGTKRAALKRMELGMYKTRGYLRQDSGDGGFILTTEEVATLFHPVGSVVLTPALERIPSARAEAPANLPRATPPVRH